MILVTATGAAVACNVRARRARGAGRARLQLLAAAAAAGACIAAVAAALDAAAGFSHAAATSSVAAFALVVAASCAGSTRAGRRAAGNATAVVTAASALVIAGTVSFLTALLLAGRLPESRDHWMVAPALFGAALTALLYGPLRGWLARATARSLYGSRRPLDEVLRTLGERAAAGVPFDELALQLAESLRGSVRVRSAEVWSRPGVAFELVAAAPDRGARALELDARARGALAGVAVAGRAWLDVWAPALVAGRHERRVRVAPATHAGTVLGYVVVERAQDDEPFSTDDDVALAEVGRRLGEVLHTRRLDTTLQAALDDLRASRARLVAAADAERRRIERNLHDGAQQHLVALAVSLRLAREVVAEDAAAGVEMLEQLRADVLDTIEQLRDLAHGIYPPLLVDAGLREALRAAARRSPLAVTLDADGVERHPTEVEAAVYFCCLEALQNAAKHAPGANVRIALRDDAGALRFEVRDDGPGFDQALVRAGHGFQNMADRLGAIGGSIAFESSPGRGTVVRGSVAVLPDRRASA